MCTDTQSFFTTHSVIKINEMIFMIDNLISVYNSCRV